MTSEHGQLTNPHDSCAWRAIAECEDCPVSGRLKCRFSWGRLLYFAAGFLPFAVAVVAGMIRGGFGRPLLGWFVFY